jgi:hypothetical protein
MPHPFDARRPILASVDPTRPARVGWWQDRACGSGKAPLRWFYPSSSHEISRQQYSLARKACAVCPVAVDCLRDAYATDHEPMQMEGLRAGFTARERKLLWARYPTPRSRRIAPDSQT